jgi:hypothetical protein
MKTRNFSVIPGLILWIVLATSCENGKGYRNTFFSTPFPKNGVDMTRVLGSQFSLVDEKDTLCLVLQFDEEKKTNLFFETKTGYKFMECRVSKFRGLYYFSEETQDSLWEVHAVRISGDKIYGLGSGVEQMAMLRREIDHGQYTAQVLSEDNETGKMVLAFDRKLLKTFYKSVTDSFPALTLLPEDESDTIMVPEESIFSDTTATAAIPSSRLVSRYYPNPATDHVTIEMEASGKYRLQITDFYGRIKKAGIENEKEIRLDLSDINSGPVVITIHDLQTKKTETITVIRK